MKGTLFYFVFDDDEAILALIKNFSTKSFSCRKPFVSYAAKYSFLGLDSPRSKYLFMYLFISSFYMNPLNVCLISSKYIT